MFDGIETISDDEYVAQTAADAAYYAQRQADADAESESGSGVETLVNGWNDSSHGSNSTVNITPPSRGSSPDNLNDDHSRRSGAPSPSPGVRPQDSDDANWVTTSSSSDHDSPSDPSSSSEGTIDVDNRDGNTVFFNEGDGYLLVKRLGDADNHQTMIVRNLQNGKLFFRKRIHRNGGGDDREFHIAGELDAHFSMPSLVQSEMPSDDDINNNSSLIFSYCNGGSLQTLLDDYRRDRRVIPEIFVWHIIRQLIEAVAYMHTGWWRGDANPPNFWRPWSHNDLSTNNIQLHYASDRPKCLPDIRIWNFHLGVEIDDAAMQLNDSEESNDSNQENIDPEEPNDSDQENIPPEPYDYQLHPNIVSDMRALLRIIISLVNFTHNPEDNPPVDSPFCPASYSQDLRTTAQNFLPIAFNGAVPVPRAMDLVRNQDHIAWRQLHRLEPRFSKTNAPRRFHTSAFVKNLPLLFTEGSGQVPQWKTDQIRSLARPWEWRNIDMITYR